VDCASVLANVHQVSDLDVLDYCADFYWHHGELETPEGSFNGVIALARRMLEIDPMQEEVYSSVSWLLWSKWATWKKDPAQMPDGEGKDLEAVALLLKGGEFYADSASYWASAVAVLFPLAKGYQPNLYPMIIEWAIKADQLGDLEQKVRARLNIGLAYRNLSNRIEAKAWFSRVLEIDPQNPIALRELKKLENP
jgi:tetratricopeptide (TPR) repeat protein